MSLGWAFHDGTASQGPAVIEDVVIGVIEAIRSQELAAGERRDAPLRFVGEHVFMKKEEESKGTELERQVWRSAVDSENQRATRRATDRADERRRRVAASGEPTHVVR